MLRPAVRSSVIARLQLGIEHVDHAAPIVAGMLPVEAEIADQFMQTREAPHVLLPFGLRELDQQQRCRFAAHERLQRGAEHRDLARKRNHGRVDQLDRDGCQLDDVLRRRHRLVEAAEVNGTDRAASEHRRELQFDRGGECQRALRAHQDVREVDVVASRHQRIDVVAADAALNLGKTRRDLIGLTRAEREQIARQRLERRQRRQVGQVRRDRAEVRLAAIGQDRIDREDVLAGVAVAQRAPAARVVRGHPADGGARSGRDIDREPQTVRPQRAIEIVEHDARLDLAAASFDIEIENAGEMLRAVDHQRGVDGLPGLRRAAAARQHGDALLARQRNRALRFVDRARRHHAERHDLVVRGIGGVAAAREAVEMHLSRDLGLEPPLQPRQQAFRHMHLR